MYYGIHKITKIFEMMILPILAISIVISGTLIMSDAILITKASNSGNPYIGGYYSQQVKLTNAVYMVSFITVNPNNIPKNNRVSTVLSIAGGYHEGTLVHLSGYVYQAAWSVQNDGKYRMSVNIWYKNKIIQEAEKIYKGTPFEVETYIYMEKTYILFVFKADGNVVGVYIANKSRLNIPDEFFLVGSRSINNINIKFMQFGTEAIQSPVDTSWHVYQYQIYYYDPSVGYTWSTAYSTQGTTSYIIPYYLIGGVAYRGADYNYYPSDYCYDMGTLEWYWRGGNYILPPDTYLFPGP